LASLANELTYTASAAYFIPLSFCTNTLAIDILKKAFVLHLTFTYGHMKFKRSVRASKKKKRYEIRVIIYLYARIIL
jgi:hypothetical protein